MAAEAAAWPTVSRRSGLLAPIPVAHLGSAAVGLLSMAALSEAFDDSLVS